MSIPRDLTDVSLNANERDIHWNRRARWIGAKRGACMQNHRWLLALLCLLISGVGICQTNVGRISGVVYDPSGAPVPGCMVTAVNAQTGLRKGIRTESGGYYVLTALPAGSYVLTAEQAGFSMSEQSDVKLDAASQRSIDFHLQ